MKPATGNCTIPKPVRTFADPVTGVTLHQLTAGPEPSAHLYFTRCGWLNGGKYFLFARRQDGAVNLHVACPSGEVRQVTHLPPPPLPNAMMPHMHRRFFAWEGESLLLRLPAIHPTEPLFAYSWMNEVHLVDIERGTDELLLIFPRSESEQPFSGLHTSFTADGRDLIFTTTRRRRAGEERLDPPTQEWNTALRDEDHFVSAIRRYDFTRRTLGDVIFQSNGEQSHLLTCPWNPEILLWVNYLHSSIYTIRRDGSHLRTLLSGRHLMPGHYNWDVAHRRLTVLVTDTTTWDTTQCSLDVETGQLRRYPVGGGKHQWHQNASPDGRWIVTDHLTVGDRNGLSLIDQQTDTLRPLCQLGCSWGMSAPDGGPMKSEFLHPNPSWSPDGRYVAVSTDFGQGIDAVQVFLVDTATINHA